MKLPALKEIIDERKETAVVRLSESYAKNRLPLEEYERLVEYINKIESERELVVVEKIVAEYNEPETPVNDSDYDDEPDYSHSTSNLTALSSRTISGPFKSGEQFVNILGTTYIKVRKSDLTKRKTVLNIVSVLGECVISVESGIRVSNKAIPVLGSASVDSRINKHAQQGDAEIVVSGMSLLGEVKVKLLKE